MYRGMRRYNETRRIQRLSAPAPKPPPPTVCTCNPCALRGAPCQKSLPTVQFRRSTRCWDCDSHSISVRERRELGLD